MSAKVAIIMGSKNDYRIMKDAEEALKVFGISFKTEVVSAHRWAEDMVDWALNAHEKGIEVIIAGAGAAAHLPGMVASLTPLPVIGVPITVGKLKGIDALMSIQQMPKGVPVATVAIDNAFNAGVLAARIIGSGNPKVTKKLLAYKKQNQRLVKQMKKDLSKITKSRG
jgi:phosphoribosylaminoimidazole carboxylase PurE protein